MTTFFQPMQRKDNGRWEMTKRTGSTGPYPQGYCAGSGPGDPAKYHSDGHASEEEACACYTAHCLDTAVEFVEDPGTQKRCETCGDWTTGRGRFRGDVVGGPPAPLCPKHQTREDMAAVARRHGVP